MTSVKVTRHGCGDRHLRAKNNGRTPGARVGDRAIFAAACRDCGIGAAHARGERPDVMIASLTARVTETKTEEGVMSRAKFYEHEGEKLTTKQLADRAVEGVTQSLIGIRLAKGWTVEEAITIPNGESRPNRKNGRPLVEAPSRETQARREQRAERAREREPKLTATTVRPPTNDATLPDVALVLTRLGYVVEDAGLVPAGRLLLVRAAA
jgi:hypothetical protein